VENKGISFKWNVNLREQFRSGVYDSLENIISVVDNVNCSSRDSINSMLNEFSEIVRVVANPLFSKSCYFKNKTSFRACDHNNDWFDHECVEYRKRYLDALNKFNSNKTYENRMVLCEHKKYYKGIIRKKKNTKYKKKMIEIEALRKSKPREFWKKFKAKSTNKSDQIPLNTFRDFFLRSWCKCFEWYK